MYPSIDKQFQIKSNQIKSELCRIVAVPAKPLCHTATCLYLYFKHQTRSNPHLEFVGEVGQESLYTVLWDILCQYFVFNAVKTWIGKTSG